MFKLPDSPFALWLRYLNHGRIWRARILAQICPVFQLGRTAAGRGGGRVRVARAKSKARSLLTTTNGCRTLSKIKCT